MKEKLHAIAVLAVALVTTAVFLSTVGDAYPIRQWLLWTVLQLWAWQALLVVAMFAAGNLIFHRTLGRARADETPHLIRLTVAAALGAITFALGMTAAGTLGWLRPAWAVLWPLAMLVTGLSGAPHSLRELLLPLRAAPESHPGVPPTTTSVTGTVVVAFGCLALALVYLGLFSPDSVTFDAAWMHLTIAQDYAREGRIVRFEADWTKSIAHLGSLVNTWAFLLPGLGAPPVRWMMALHTEFTFLVLTLVAVTAAVEWTSRRRARHAWVVFFLFPGLFVDDSNLGASADHFAAFFAVPAFLTAVQAARTMDPRWWALFGALSGAALITKYQTFYFVVPLSAMLALAWLRALRAASGRAAAARRNILEVTPLPGAGGTLGRACRGIATVVTAPLLAVAAMVAVSGTHFIRNWVYYGNPVYPFAQGLFPSSHPRFADAPQLAENILMHFGTKPPTDLVLRFTQAARYLVGFSFNNRAVFGSLFTLSVPLAIFLPAARRPRLVIALCFAAVFLWAWTYRVERNLQIVAPLLAVATAAVLVRAWELGRPYRLAVMLLVGAQLAWSGDHFFLGNERVHSALALIRSGYDGRASSRFDAYAPDRVAVEKWLPANAKVLLHNLHMNLGIDRPLLHDGLGFQGLIDPRTFRSPRDMYERFHELGITHVVSSPGFYPAPTKQEEVLFAAFADRYGARCTAFAPLSVLSMPEVPPPVETPYTVMVLGIAGYADGIYDITQLRTVEIMPGELQEHGSPRHAVSPQDAATRLLEVNAVLLGNSQGALRDSPLLTTRFHRATGYAAFSVWVHQI